MKQEIIDYYDDLASSYDESRFGGTYGRFIDGQERKLLAGMLPTGEILELACGTGRLSSFATVACDASRKSLDIATGRCTTARFACCDAEKLPFRSGHFSAVFAFHFLMHLESEAISRVLAEAARVLKPGGVFVVDVLSPGRKRGHNSRQPWHAATALSLSDLQALAGAAGLRIERHAGILVLPIQRFPSALRLQLCQLDMWLGGVVPFLASYHVAYMRKGDA
ncbi:MAG: methyltransferase domain-containing protein [Micropepsaceae bacterium]